MATPVSITKSVSRPAILAGGSTVALTGAVAALPAAANASDPHAALRVEWLEVRAAYEIERTAYDAASDSVPEWAQSGWPHIRGNPLFNGVPDNGLGAIRLKELHEYHRKHAAVLASWFGPTPTPGQKLDIEIALEKHWADSRARVRWWKAKHGEQVRLCRAADLPGFERRTRELLERRFALEMRILNTPAQSVLGIALKLAVADLTMIENYCIDEMPQTEADFDLDERYLRSALRDAERLSAA